ncbi:MAG: peptidoglycan DD-metalloendopeptidase family protein [Gloeomargarita sp. SKYBB_i_bin120]|nr:peptidoglycan DD-metalloendopeptidase family protein [Gloeomargarita sp. SKYG98]MCS7291706.1 peptidoglycan DD-metalloendopeptidase family protein [Gloeomargarita sp. SKYB120]MDW8177265.1 peptidoglycan DD-metalloendopeptidase family protein [Gloeomargarita sp. SKYBB_i_bin120]
MLRPLATSSVLTGLAAVGALVGQGMALAEEPAVATEGLPSQQQEAGMAAVPEELVTQHRVRAGETLWQLSYLYQVTVEELARFNGLQPDQVLEVGQVLKIPPRSLGPNRAESLLERVRQQALARQRPSLAAMMEAPTLVAHSAQEVSPKQAWEYRVQPGDTLSAIARRYRVSLAELVRFNQLRDPDWLYVGQVLRVPATPGVSPASAVAQRPVPQVLARLRAPRLTTPPTALPAPPVNPLLGTDALGEVGKAPALDTDNLRRQPAVQDLSAILPRVFPPVLDEGPADNRQALSLPPIGEVDKFLPKDPTFFRGYIWPARGVLTSGFGPRWGRMHQGIDIAGPVGTPIVAAASGTVIFAGWNAGGYGNLVKIWHDNGSVTYYAHNHRILVRENQRVEQGQLIAEMGSTGFSTGPHLHFEIRKRDRGPVNPLAFLPSRR